MSNYRPLLKSELVAARAATHSNAEAARHLGVSIGRFKKYATLYGIWQTGINPSGKGAKRRHRTAGKVTPLTDILAGKHPSYNLKLFKDRILRSGIFPLECALCGYDKTRPNGLPPLLIWFRDNDRTNKRLENIELRCFNCMYLTNGVTKYPIPFDWKLDKNTASPAALNQDFNEVMTADELEEMRREFLQTNEYKSLCSLIIPN